MTIEDMKPIIKEPRMTYGDFEFEVGTDYQSDFVDVYVSTKAFDKLKKNIQPFQIRLLPDQFIYDDPSAEVNFSKLEEGFAESHQQIEDTEGFANAINKSIESMRGNPNYPWKDKKGGTGTGKGFGP